MKHSVRIRLCALAAALLTAAGSLCGCAGQRVPADTQTRDTEGGYAYRIDVSPYIDAIRADHPGFLTLVNKAHPVDEDFAPARLSDMDKSLTLYGKDVQLEATAALAAEALIRELWSMGWKDVKITSGYRTFTYQSQLFNTYIANEKSAHPSWTTAEAEREVLTYSARPGTSEHQTGLCMDLIIADLHPTLDESFAEHPCYAWLLANAHEFGFVLRFPDGKEDVTGYSFEPWHYRFVGIGAATAIYEGGLTLEEYLEGGQ